MKAHIHALPRSIFVAHNDKDKQKRERPAIPYVPRCFMWNSTDNDTGSTGECRAGAWRRPARFPGHFAV